MTNKIASPTKPDARPVGAEDSCCDSATGAVALAETLRPEDEELAMLAKAVAHPVRILILRNLLRIGACYFGRLADLLPVAPSTASQHLTILKDAGLVKGEIEGERPCYCVDLQKLRRMQHLIGDL
ncbi:helix-turn-helix transcriptional regulator [Ferrovibrio sp.]|uniref:ArsR/SmtB family transcription factor n=1 Tax=Ferrovibrio sp. TaxID=1917215 RepID=UPI000CA67530|nr:metalloregulator ArsR/SmtB family transcription factor [Ferrovibrio sp.]PJI37906.1 MAG: transcriptional regulator [Ferrovibrio sp.]